MNGLALLIKQTRIYAATLHELALGRSNDVSYEAPAFFAQRLCGHSLAVKLVGVSIGECNHVDDVENVELVVPEHAHPSLSGTQW